MLIKDKISAVAFFATAIVINVMLGIIVFFVAILAILGLPAVTMIEKLRA